MTRSGLVLCFPRPLKDDNFATASQAWSPSDGKSDGISGTRRLVVRVPQLLALVGLVGTGVGAVLQGFWNTRLEREKFEFSLIQKALDTADKNEAGRNLKSWSMLG